MKKIISFFLMIALVLVFCVASAEEWVCPNCGKTNTTDFCTSCGTKHESWICPNCGAENGDAYCGSCGMKRPSDEGNLCGTWFFLDTENVVYLELKQDKTCLVKTSNGYIKGKYEIADQNLSLFFSDCLSGVPDYALPSGDFCFVDDMLFYKPFGYAVRTEVNLDSFTVTMDGHSMDDTILDGDELSIVCAYPEDIKRNDIVAVNYPDRNETVFVKRVVGLPGETIELREGYLYINYEKLDETFVNDEYRSGFLNEFGPYTIPEEKYFVLGDHRNNSNDSRSIGPLDADRIIGVVTTINGKQICEMADSRSKSVGDAYYDQSAHENNHPLIEDDADLLTADEESSLEQALLPLCKYCTPVFWSTDKKDSRNVVEKTEENLNQITDAKSCVVFTIDMYTRRIAIYCTKDAYSRITMAVANSITDSVYMYATKGKYYECAEKAFDRVYQVFNSHETP